MTAHSLDNLWSLPEEILARFELGVRLDAKPFALIDEAIALRRCALYRKAFKGIAISYPADFHPPTGKPLELTVKTDHPKRSVLTVPIVTAATPRPAQFAQPPIAPGVAK